MWRMWNISTIIEGKIEGKIGVTGRRGRRLEKLPIILRKRKDSGN